MNATLLKRCVRAMSESRVCVCFVLHLSPKAFERLALRYEVEGIC